jgi:hypothetical protein
MRAADGHTFALPMARYEALDWAGPLLAKIDSETRADALSAFLPAFQDRYLQVLRSPQTEFDLRIGEADDVLLELQRDGFALRAMAPRHRSRIRELVVPMAREMETRLDTLAKIKFSDGQVVLDFVEHQPIYAAVEDALREAGTLTAFSAYAGRPVGLLRLAVQVNTARETLKKYGEIDAQGLPGLKTSYFHVDSNDWPNVKALIYVSDVELDQGPFRYVPGSHRIMGAFEAVVRRTNDKLRQRAHLFLALPPELGQHANFGDYINETTPGAAALLEAERAVCDGACDLVMFDNNGVHRGGMVRQGHRYMLQCQFWHESKLVELRRMELAKAGAASA